jgi:4'-phosphopantetheinyl transferase
MRLEPHPWPARPGRGDPIGVPLDPDPAAPPLVLRIDRREPAVRARLPALPALLGDEERRRLDRYRRAEDRERFLLGRGVLRLCLAELLGDDPATLPIGAGPRGKPRLAPGAARLPAAPLPRFNVSHAGDLVLIALHGRREVGVDVERRRPDLDWRPIAARCLPQATGERLEALPPDAREMAFLQAWCELEAELKALGTGLGGERPAAGTASLWRLAMPADYRGAVALL